MHWHSYNNVLHLFNKAKCRLFRSIMNLENHPKITLPFRPKIHSKTDVSYFDTDFTREAPQPGAVLGGSQKLLRFLKIYFKPKILYMHITNSAILYNARCMSISRQLLLKQCFTRVKKCKPSKFLSVVNYSW